MSLCVTGQTIADKATQPLKRKAEFRNLTSVPATVSSKHLAEYSDEVFRFNPKSVKTQIQGSVYLFPVFGFLFYLSLAMKESHQLVNMEEWERC